MNQIRIESPYDRVPQEMKELSHWVAWKFEVTPKGKITKVPYNVNSGFRASSTNKKTWANFDTALSRVHLYDGLGFMFEGSGLFGVDVDSDNPEEITRFLDGDNSSIFYEFYNLSTYSEVSPSGHGMHFYFKGTLPGNGFKNSVTGVEMYSQGRYFTVTGDSVGEVSTLIDGTEIIKPLYEKYRTKKEVSSQSLFQGDGNNFTADQLIEKAYESKNGYKFKELFLDGNLSGYANDHSSADQALANSLLWWTNGDIHKADAMFRKSALYRDKWDRKTGNSTYGELTLLEAKRLVTEGFTGKPTNTSSINNDKHQILKNKSERIFPETTGYGTDGNGVKWIREYKKTDDKYIDKLVRNYINHEKMASLVVDLSYNEFTENIEYTKKNQRTVVDDFFISDMYRKVSDIYTDLPQRDMEHAINNLGMKKTFNPIKELVESAVWDKQERIDTFFIDFFGLDDAPYYREATRKWFIAAIARVYDPGIKWDSTLVLRGAQGTGKTTAIERLAMSSEYYVSLSEKIDKDLYLKLNGGWLVELEELEFIKVNSVGAVKSFLTAKSDTYRKPYGRGNKTYQRHSIFIATINDKNFLKDRTGNRRFIPLLIDDKPTPKLSVFNDLTKDYCHQLWAEALTYYKNKESLLISEESEKAFDVLRGSVEEINMTAETLLEMLEIEIPLDYYSRTLEQRRIYLNGTSQESLPYVELRKDITTKEIITEFFGRDIDGDLRGNQLAKEVNEIMSNLPGWKKSDHLTRLSPDKKRKRVKGFKRIE